MIDNRGGTRTRRVFLGGRDPERIVHFAFSPPSLDVFAGETGTARLRIEAPPPAAGQEVSPLADRAGHLAGRPRPGGNGDLRAGDVGRAGGRPADHAAGSQRGPGPGHGRRAARGDHRQPRRPPCAAGLPVRAGPGTAGPVHLLAAVAGCAARRHRPGPGAAGGAAARTPGRRRPGRSPSSPPTAPGRSRRAGRFVQITSPKPVETPVGAQAGAEPGPGPGHPDRPVPGDRRQPAGHPAPPGHPGRHRSRTGAGRSRSGRRWWRWTAGQIARSQRPDRRLPARARPRGHPAVLGLRLRRRQGGRDRRHVHPDRRRRRRPTNR